MKFIFLRCGYIASLMFAFVCSHAQSKSIFMQSAGFNVSAVTAKHVGYYSSVTFIRSDATYFPRLLILQNDNASVSIGVPFGLGFGVLKQNDGYNTEEKLYWDVDLPVAVDLNIGCKSVPSNNSKLGGYIGGGFGYSYVSWKPDGERAAISYGPMARGGFRFGIKEMKMAITLGLYYKSGLEREKYKTYGMYLFVDL